MNEGKPTRILGHELNTAVKLNVRHVGELWIETNDERLVLEAGGWVILSSEAWERMRALKGFGPQPTQQPRRWDA